MADGLPEAAAANSEGALTSKSKRRKTQHEYAQRKREEKKEANKDNPAKERESVKAVRLQPTNKELDIIHRMLKPRERYRGNRVVSVCVCESTFIESKL